MDHLPFVAFHHFCGVWFDHQFSTSLPLPHDWSVEQVLVQEDQLLSDMDALCSSKFSIQKRPYSISNLIFQLLFLADWWSNSEVRIYTDPQILGQVGQHNAIILMNHHFELDWCFGWMIADRCKILGNARVFVKKMLKYVPVMGWAWNFSDVAYLERNIDKDEETMTKAVANLSEYTDPMWLLIFAEGTRISPDKLEASRDFARSRGLPVLRHCK